MQPIDIDDDLGLADELQLAPGPRRRASPESPDSPDRDPAPPGSWTDPRFLVPLVLFLAAVFVIGLAWRSGSLDSDDAADTTPLATQTALAADVQAAQVRAGFADVTVREENGFIILEGEADSSSEAVAMGAVARSVTGVDRIDNRLVVVSGAVEVATDVNVTPTTPRTLDERLAAVGPITFEPASASLTPEGARAVDSAAIILGEVTGVAIEIHGHTDADGDSADNQRLSHERAEAVVQALVTRGIGEDRLTAVGFGESDPVAPNITEEGRAKNRRIEFFVVG